jgi:hypothetical protein
MGKKLLGAEHPHTIIYMSNLASTYLNQGRWNEAEQLHIQVTEMTKNSVEQRFGKTQGYKGKVKEGKGQGFFRKGQRFF